MASDKTHCKPFVQKFGLSVLNNRRRFVFELLTSWRIMQQVPKKVVWDEYTGNEKGPNLPLRAALTSFFIGITTYFIIVLTSSDVHCDGGFTPGELFAKLMFFLSMIACLVSVLIVFLRPLRFKTVLYVLFLVGLCIASFFFIYLIDMTEAFCWGWVYGQGAN